MEIRPVNNGRIFHPYPAGSQTQILKIDRWMENNNNTSHSARQEESYLITPIQQNQDTDSKYIVSDGKPGCITRNDIFTNMIMEASPSPTRCETRTRSG